MRPGREMDARIAREIFGHEVWATNKTIHERTALGKQPLRKYSKDTDAAWMVAQKAQVSVIPVEGGKWFAFCTPLGAWRSPQEFADFLRKADYSGSGAAIGEDVAQVICEAALRALDKRALENSENTQSLQ